MKQVIIVGALITLGALISCNEKELEENNQFIIGTWEANFESISGCSDPGMDGDGELVCTETDCIRFTFEEGGVYFSNTTIDGETFGEQGTFSLDIDKINFCIEDEGTLTCKGGTYEVNATRLSFSITDADTGCTTLRIFEKIDPDA